MLLSNVVQIVHFGVEAVYKQSQEALSVLKAVAGLLYELCGLGDLLLKFQVLLT